MELNNMKTIKFTEEQYDVVVKIINSFPNLSFLPFCPRDLMNQEDIMYISVLRDYIEIEKDEEIIYRLEKQSIE